MLSVPLIGSPFTISSILWISELPHVIVLVCFVVGLIAITSKLTEGQKLAVSALLSRENGLALTAFLPYFVRPGACRRRRGLFHDARAGSWTCDGACGLRRGRRGYFSRFLTDPERRERFPGHAIYQLYAYNILAQVAAIMFMVTAWGQISSGMNREVVIETLSTLAILAGATAAYRKHSVVFVVLAVVAIGGTVFSYACARDRHLALPALAYGLLLVTAADELSR